ncbi:MAG: ATP-binding protein, partial [Steroidobacteraceae bacterium]
ARVLAAGGRPALERWLRSEAHPPPDVTLYVLDESSRDILGREVPELYAAFIRKSVVGAPEPPGSNYQPVRLAPRLTGPGGEGYAFLVLPNRIGVLGNPTTTLGLLAVALLVIGSVAWLIARAFARPIGELQRVAREIASGQLDARVPAGIAARPDEIGALAADFNSMADQLARLLSGRQQLMGELSHALRSPLARLQAALALPNPRERAELEIARLDRVIGDLLRLSRLEAAPELVRRLVRLDALLAALVRDEELEAAARQVRLELDCDPDLAVVGDPELLHGACENLLRNAIRYTHAGTPVGIEARRDGALLRLAVQDRGPGVPPEYLERIFERWTRVPDRPGDPGGTGLGLAIARRVIELHGGRVDARPRAGGGLVVSVELPLAQLTRA